MSQDRLLSLALIVMENYLAASLNFEDVIEELSKKRKKVCFMRIKKNAKT